MNTIKGSNYENFVLDHILKNNLYDQAWLWKNVPEIVLMKTNLYNSFIENPLYRFDMGADIVAIKNDNIYFIQCKNFTDSTICMENLAGIYFLCSEYNLKGVVYYNGKISTRVNKLAKGFLTYINLNYDNIIDLTIESPINIECNLVAKDYQLEAFNTLKDKNRSILSLPCGMGKTFTSFLIAKNYNNIILIAPLRQLIIQLMDDYNKYTNYEYNNILISSDGSRNDINIISNLKDKNIIGSTYHSVNIINKIIDKLTNVIIVIDEFHNLSDNNINDNENEMNKILKSNNKILFLSATPN